jgi:hypothetical protein
MTDGIDRMEDVCKFLPQIPSCTAKIAKYKSQLSDNHRGMNVGCMGAQAQMHRDGSDLLLYI